MAEKLISTLNFNRDKDVNIFNRLERNQKIYRIFHIDRLKEMIKNQMNTLVRPSLWDDPFENFFLNTDILYNNEYISLRNLRDSWYGQCWTTNKDTDAMWRIYSPNKFGARISTTVGELFDSIYDTSDKFAQLKYFIGKVQYKTQGELIEFLKNYSFMDLAIGGQNDQFAKTLCIKREAFSHENEVRLLISKTPEEIEQDNSCLYHISIDFDKLFTDICLDPRLSANEFAKIKCELQNITKLPIYQSDLYKFDPIPIKLN